MISLWRKFAIYSAEVSFDMEIKLILDENKISNAVQDDTFSAV